MSSIIEIVSIWTSGKDKAPSGYALAEDWDAVSHDLNDYVALDRATYELPDGYEVRRDIMGLPYICATDETSCPLKLMGHWRGGEQHPAFWRGDGSKLVVLDKCETDPASAAKPANVIDLVAVWKSTRDKIPTYYALGEAWDETQHYFTDYVRIDSYKYELPDDYVVAKDATGAYQIYRRDYRKWPVTLDVADDGEPVIIDGDKTVTMHEVTED